MPDLHHDQAPAPAGLQSQARLFHILPAKPVVETQHMDLRGVLRRWELMILPETSQEAASIGRAPAPGQA